MSRQHLIRLLSLLFSFTLIAAACGSGSGSDGDTSAEDTSDDAASEDDDMEDDDMEDDSDDMSDDEDDMEDDSDDMEDDSDDMEDDSDDMAEAGSIGDMESQWADERADIVSRIQSDGYGVADGVLTGPGGFEIDTNSCPEGWSDTEGIDGGTLTIGHTTALSGNLAAYGNIAAGMEAYFDYVNENGGVGGLQIELVVKDDGYVATQTIEQVDELLQSVKPFAIETLGSPNTLAVYDKLNENCVPHPLAMTGHPAWGDPVNHPWTTGNQMSYATEAILWGAWIKNNMSDQLPVTVAGLVMDNDFGLAYEDGMQTYADENPDVVSEFTPIRHDPAAPTVTNEMTTIAAGEPDVFISMTAGNPCLLAVEEAARSGLKDSGAVLFAPSVCKDPSSFMIPAGDAGDGMYIVGGGLKVCTDPAFDGDVYIEFMRETLTAAGHDWAGQGNFCTGFSLFAWPHVEALKIAAELDGGITRTNYILALRTMNMTAPFLLPGITFAMDGNDDAYFIEGSDISQYVAADEGWKQIGDVVDLNGSSPNCVWSDTGC